MTEKARKITKAFEEAEKLIQCQEVATKEYCEKYIVKDNECGTCPFYVDDAVGEEAIVLALEVALTAFNLGILNDLIKEM